MVYVRPSKHYFKYGFVPVRWAISVGCHRPWIFGKSEIIYLKLYSVVLQCSDRQGNRTDTPGSASGERKQHTEVTEIHIKMRHTKVTEVHIKLTVKRNAVKNIQIAE
jgi:hypothetical protein